MGSAYRHDHHLRLTSMRLRATVVACACVWTLVAAAAVDATPAAAPGLSNRLTRALAGPYLPLRNTAAIAVELETGTVVFAHNDTKPVNPASNEKLPVAWAALVELGPAYRFHTELYGVGSRVGATWEGDLVLKGYGDPTLATTDLAGLARKVRQLGITAVTGRVRGDESFYDRQRGVAGWKRGFLGIESPPLSALVVDRAAGWPALSPPLLAAKKLTAQLAGAGVNVAGRPGLGRAPASAVALASDRSVPLVEILRFMDHESDNFTAEMLLKQLGAATGAVGTTAGGAHVVTAAMRHAGIPMTGVRIADGSGLSPSDRLTTSALVGILEAAWSDPAVRTPFVRSLAVAGMSGTLKNRLPQLKGLVRAKTGTTDLACSLSGFVADRFAFVIIENGSPVAYWVARQAQDRFVTLLAREA
jgi:serine-type D-Ala-D-Ala carboxypeptidase/endopeptidase (penicillin-binding protein 4)